MTESADFHSSTVFPHAEDEQHEINAVYSRQPDGTKYGKYMPVLSCSCGYWTQQCDWWEESGSLMDDHLKEFRDDG